MGENNALGRLYIQGTDVNVRTDASLKALKKDQVNKPATFLVSQVKKDEQGHDWLQIEGRDDEWIYYDPSYIIYLQNTDHLDPTMVASIDGKEVNLRTGPNLNYDIIRTLNDTDDPHVYKVFKLHNGWLNLGGEQWIYYDPSYIGIGFSLN